MFWCFRNAFRALTFTTVPKLHDLRAYWAPQRQRKVNILEEGWKSQQQQISIFPISLFTCTWNLICWETQSIFQWPFFRSMLHFQDFSHQLFHIRRSVHISDRRALSVVLMTLNWSQHISSTKARVNDNTSKPKTEKDLQTLTSVCFSVGRRDINGRNRKYETR